jgi:twinkle protein
MKTAADIKADLAARAEAVAQHLLPRGKRVGSEWCAGDVNGSEGQSLKVCLVGSKAGVWADFAAGSGGDLLDLWGAAKGCTFVEALKQAKEYLGVRDTGEDRTFRRSAAKTYTKPETTGIAKLESSGPVFDYLTKTRGISPEVLHRYRQAQTNGANGPECVFPVCSSDGRTVEMLKFLAIRRGPDGKKIIRASKDSRPHLFGWQAMPATARDVVITEGEIDAMTVADWGYPALSVPSGADNMDWIEHDFEALARFDRIFVCTDADDAGHKCAGKIAERLGRARCYRVIIPGFKDVNDALVSGRFVGPDFADAARGEAIATRDALSR